MKYAEKEKALINAMEADNFAKFGGDKNMAYDTLENCLEAFPEYANIVIRMEAMIPIWRRRYEGQDLRDRIQEIDSSRRMIHDNAITNLNVLNRICKMHGLEPFADVDTSDRNAVADFVGEFVSEIYANGTHKGMDDLTKEYANKEFPKKNIHEHVTKIHGERIEPITASETDESENDYEL